MQPTTRTDATKANETNKRKERKNWKIKKRITSIGTASGREVLLKSAEKKMI